MGKGWQSSNRCAAAAGGNWRAPLEYQYKLLLGSGVTTVRVFSIGSMNPQQMVAERHRSGENRIIAPRMHVYPFWRDYPNDPRFNSAADAPAVVQQWESLGVDGVRMAGLPGEYPDIFKAVADDCHRQHKGLAAPIAQEAGYPMNALRVAADGASTIEHHYGYAEASFTDQRIQLLPPDYNYSSGPDGFYQTGAVWLQANLQRLHGYVIDQLLAIQAKTDFTMVPTMDVYEANRDLARAKTLPWHRPLEAIHSATEVGAISPGNHRLGAVRAGYLADPVVLTANPLADIKVMYGTGATRQTPDGHAVQVKAVKYTLRDGVVYDSQALMRDVREMVAKARAQMNAGGQEQ